MRQQKIRLLVTGLLQVLAGLIIVGSAFLPWITVTVGPAATITVHGTSAGLRWYFSGWPTFGAGIAMAILGAIAASVSRASWAFIVGLVAAIVAGGFAISDMIQQKDAFGQMATGHIGVGPWLTLFGAGLGIIAGIAGLVAGSRRS
jgi:hypothetical protein